MDLEYKTKVAQELLGLPEVHDHATLFDALQHILNSGARDGLGNALADLQETVARIYEPVSVPWYSLAYSNPRAAAHVAAVRWLTGELVDLREVAEMVCGSQERHVVTDALRCLAEWVEGES